MINGTRHDKSVGGRNCPLPRAGTCTYGMNEMNLRPSRWSMMSAILVPEMCSCYYSGIVFNLPPNRSLLPTRSFFNLASSRYHPLADLPLLLPFLRVSHRNKSSPVLVYMNGPLTVRMVDLMDMRSYMLNHSHRVQMHGLGD